MNCSIQRVGVTALAAALPRRRLAFSELGEMYGELDVKRIVRTTGIEAVRVAGSLSTGDLCHAAAKHLLDTHGVDARSIDGLVLVAQTPDRVMPPTSALLQHRLSLRNDCVALDINYGCSGYIYGLYQAALMIASGGCRRVIVCTGDVITKLLKRDDRHVRLLFGDAATATLVEAAETGIAVDFRTDGSGAEHLCTPLDYIGSDAAATVGGHLVMDGGKVMEFVLEAVPKMLRKFLLDQQIELEQVQLWAMHQANAFIVNYLRKTLRVNGDLMPVNVRHVGNTGPSSIPLLLCMSRGLSTAPPERAVLCGFGVGLSIGAAYLPLSGAQFYAPVDVSD